MLDKVPSGSSAFLSGTIVITFRSPICLTSDMPCLVRPHPAHPSFPKSLINCLPVSGGSLVYGIQLTHTGFAERQLLDVQFDESVLAFDLREFDGLYPWLYGIDNDIVLFEKTFSFTGSL